MYKDGSVGVFPQVSPELGNQYADVIAAGDVALYGGLTALASFDRAELKRSIVGEHHLPRAARAQSRRVHSCNIFLGAGCVYAAVPFEGASLLMQTVWISIAVIN